MAAPTAAGDRPAGAASRKIRPDSLISPEPACSISTTTTSVAIASARANPVSMMISPATAVAMNAYRSVTTCWNAPARLRLRGRPARIGGSGAGDEQGGGEVHHHAGQRHGEHVPPVTAGGVTSRRIAE